MPLSITCLTVGPVASNAYLVTDTETRDTVVVDPGDEPRRLLDALAAADLVPREIWLTHAHFDHLGAVDGLREAHPVPVRLHPADAPLYQRVAEHAALFGMRARTPGVDPLDLADGERLTLGEHEFVVLHTPGHAPGHVAFHAPGSGLVLSGDTLFRGSVGRTDLPWCDPAALARSLRERLLTLPDDTHVLPGHGEATTIGYERRTNPFLI